MPNNFVDLTVRRGWGGDFSDDEDEQAFGDTYGRGLYSRIIWKLKHNDPNLGGLNLINTPLSVDACQQIGIYLSYNAHIKTMHLLDCGLTDAKMMHLFGTIAQQNETNEVLLKEDLLGGIGITEKTLVNDVIEGVTSFPTLSVVSIDCKHFGTSGLDTFVKALAGSHLSDLGIFSCDLADISPMQQLRKCVDLKKLSITSERGLGAEHAETISVLMDNGFPKLREFKCDMGDELIESTSPTLSDNKTLRYLSFNEEIGERGIAAISKAMHDTTSFENTLASNHTLLKIICLGNFNDSAEQRLFGVSSPNLFNQGRGKKYIAWKKHLKYVAEHRNADMTPFMTMDVKLIPQLIAKMGNCRWNSTGAELSALHNIWSCEMFRDRIQTASKNRDIQSSLTAKVKALEEDTSKLADENERLKEQIAKLMAQNAKSSSTPSAASQTGSTSIAERVKARKHAKKRGRSG